jgi:hypothetical protein
VEREEADLYGLPLDEFIPARTALEKRLRKEGDRERAAAVKRLTKPTVAAWGVNQASRSQPTARRELLVAAADLRAVQERLIAGDASAADLEAAAARQRAAIDELADAAAGLLSSQGESLSEATLGRIRDTFAAAAADEGLAELIASGTLDRERRAAGLGLGGLAPPEEGAKPSAKARRRDRAASGERRADARRADAKRAKAERAARERVKETKAAAREAEKRAAAAGRAATRAAKALEDAERRLDEARAAAEAAREELEAASAASAEASREREAAEEELRRVAG